MSTFSFENIVHLYRQSSTTVIYKHKIEYTDLGKFCVGLNRFCSLLGDLASEAYWGKFIIPLKRLRFDLCAATFSNRYKFNRISETFKDLQSHLRFCKQIYPDIAPHALAILELLTNLINGDQGQDPLLDELLDLTSVKESVAWVVKESRLIPLVEELVAEFQFPNLRILHPLQLKDVTCYDQIIVIGPSRWFPESIFTAARSSRIHILVFDWIYDVWTPQKSFVNPHQSSGSSSRKYIEVDEQETRRRWDKLNADSLLDIVNGSSFVTSTLAQRIDRDEYEDVEAVCLLLEDEWAVFIDSSEGSKTLVIDPDEDTDSRINRVSVKEIQPSMFILVRNGGGGDYIIPVANRILADKAQQAREYQQHWKTLLRHHVRRRGLLETSIDLLDQGSSIANETNVRNWMSPRTISTRDYKDFLAIMKLIKLESTAQIYWDMMQCIVAAHKKAGFEIRKLLLDQVKELDMELLQKQGRMDFKLSSADEGGLTAFRIETILPETFEVPYSQLGQPFKIED